MVQSLRWAGLDDLATEIDLCHKEFVVLRCGHCGTSFGQPRTCHSRLCPYCAEARGARIHAKRQSDLSKYNNYVFLTLTRRSIKHITKDDVQFTYACWEKLYRRKFMQDRCYGAIATFEVTHRRPGFHPQLHILIATRDCPLPIKDIRKAWKGYTGAWWCHIERVKPPLADAMRELVKYPLKPIDFFKKPEALKEYVQAIQHVQLIRGYGCFRYIREAFKPHAPLSNTPCPRCGVKGYLEKIGDREPITKFRRMPWGWLYLPNAPPVL